MELSSDPGRLQVDRIVGWLESSYWAATRPRAVTEAALDGSLNFGVYAAGSEAHDSGSDGAYTAGSGAAASGPAGGEQQVAFARAITDSATFAWIADVFVDPAWRGRHIGHWLVGTVVSYLRDLGIRRIVLATRDAHRVYADLGFGALRVPETWMEIDDRVERPNPGDVQL